MKIIIDDDINMIIFLNRTYLKNIDFDDQTKLEEYFEELLLKLKNYYLINIQGFYEINVYIDKYYGVVLELQKQDIEYFGYYDTEVDMKIIIHNSEFLYKIDDFYWIDEKILKKINLYKHKGNIYLKIDKYVKNAEMATIVENSKIRYKNNYIIQEKNKIVM